MGSGLTLAQWMVHGEPERRCICDGRGPIRSVCHSDLHIAEGAGVLRRRFQIAYPNEYWPAGRPSKKSAIHHTLQARDAVFGVSYGLEYPLYFALHGEPAREVPTLRRSNAFQAVREECHAARNTLGILDISSFSKYEVTGARAAAALDRLLAGRLPAVGRIRLTPMLAPSGRLMGDLTTMRLADDRFQLGGSGYLQTWHMRWFAEHLVQKGVEIRNVTDYYGGLALIGPRHAN